MAQVETIDTNTVGMRVARETSPQTLPGTPIWRPIEPNAPAGNLGATIGTVARDFINANRQVNKGVTTTLDAAFGFEFDFTGDNHTQNWLEGFFSAALRRKAEFGNVPDGGTGAFTSTTTSTYVAASGLTIFPVGALTFGINFTNAANNGLNRVITSTSTTLTMAGTMVAETPPAGAKLTRVGHRAASADINVDAATAFPAYTSTVLDFTTFGLIPGEWIYVGGGSVIGGGDAAFQFANLPNNGFKRVRSVTATRLEVDKSTSAMVTETGTGKTIEFYFGRVVKDELGSLITHKYDQFELTLGAPDDALPAQIQSLYVKGCGANELEFNIPAENKITGTASWVGLDQETRTGAVGVKTGTRPTVLDGRAYNTSVDPKAIRISILASDESPAVLYGYATQLSLRINNNITKNPAIGVLGGIGLSRGNFVVSGDFRPYFRNVSTLDALRTNPDVTIDAKFVSGNRGWCFDLPLNTLGDGYVNLEKDRPLTQPITFAAAQASTVSVGTQLTHTCLICLFDFTPTVATLAGMA